MKMTLRNPYVIRDGKNIKKVTKTFVFSPLLLTVPRSMHQYPLHNLPILPTHSSWLLPRQPHGQTTINATLQPDWRPKSHPCTSFCPIALWLRPASLSSMSFSAPTGCVSSLLSTCITWYGPRRRLWKHHPHRRSPSKSVQAIAGCLLWSGGTCQPPAA